MNATLKTVLVVVALIAISAAIFFLPHLRTPARRRAEKIAWSACTLDDDFDTIESEIDKLAKEDSAEADEVLASLVNTYVGTHNTEVLMIAIVNRGTRIRPYLLKVRESPVYLLSCYRSPSDEDRKSFVDMMVRAIDKGEHWEE